MTGGSGASNAVWRYHVNCDHYPQGRVHIGSPHVPVYELPRMSPSALKLAQALGTFTLDVKLDAPRAERSGSAHDLDGNSPCHPKSTSRIGTAAMRSASRYRRVPG